MSIHRLFYFPIIFSILCSALVYAYHDDLKSIFGYLLTVFLSVCFLLVFKKIYKGREIDLKKHSDFFWVTIICSWISMIIIFSMPFIFLGYYYPDKYVEFSSPISSLFESVSGLTSTGLTMVIDEASLSRSIQLWRSFAQWFGGLGLFYFLSTFIKDKDTFSRIQNVFAQEAYYESKENKELKSFMQKVLWSYIALTIVVFILFTISGLPVWSAINYSLTAISTGGFGIEASSAIYFSNLVKLIFAATIILSSSPMLRINSFRKRFKEFCLYLLYIVLVLIIVFTLFSSEQSFTDTLFQGITAIGTAGFNSVRIDQLAPSILYLLSFLMLVGGCGGSTAGGIKVNRLFSYLKQVFYLVSGQRSKLNKEREAKWIFLVLWLTSLTLAIIIFKYNTDFSLSKIVFEVNSAMSCVGLSSGITSYKLASGLKVLLIIMMILGRLELVSYFIESKEEQDSDS